MPNNLLQVFQNKRSFSAGRIAAVIDEINQDAASPNRGVDAGTVNVTDHT